MTEATGTMTMKLRLNDICYKVVPLIQRGFYVVDVESHINWPYFWQTIYTVKLRLDLVVDDGECVVLPSSEKLMKELS